MKQEVKKIIAREFLIAIAVLILSAITFLSVYPYNWFKSTQINSISESINIQDKILDSLSNSYKKKSDNQDWLYNQFKERFEESVNANYKIDKSLISNEVDKNNKTINNNHSKIIRDDTYSFDEFGSVKKEKNKGSGINSYADVFDKVAREKTAEYSRIDYSKKRYALTNNDPLGILKHKKQSGTTKLLSEAQGDGSYIDLTQVTRDLLDNSKQNISFATDFWSSLYIIQRNDSISTYWDKVWPKKLVTFFITSGFKNADNLNSFIRTNTIYTTETELKDSIQKQKDIAVERKNTINNSMLSFDEQKEFAIKALLLFFIVLFPMRYLYYGIKWSISMLKN